MVLRLFRPLLAILVAVALIGAPAVQASSAVPCDTMHMANTEHQASSGDAQAPAPCKMTPACIDAIGCASLVSLPAPALSASGPLTWIAVAYGAAADAREGLSIKPILDPPIRVA
ncbi:hypothetical protein [Pseudoroseomonas ludipueritiae]|uniref:Uncharacterized protein n=1 Tax=Pseudoroseomonas ludipueritiae TaxID=198093 RepID=A0ABR7R2T9_9PROT|nr:hypothetical protein [Pseudoroseomonas ludipueritiae]MBC9176009.1 hypothetical protein [Pseudoroseomonas ludipueritiae]